MGLRAALASVGVATLVGLASACGAQVRDLLGEARVCSTAEWDARRREILGAMQRVMGPLPGRERRAPLEVRVEREEDGGRFQLRKVSYQSAPGERVPAWLLIPKGAVDRRPAMLVLHQTTPFGKDEPAGRAGLPNLHIGKELAERGYVVLSPDYPTLGEHAIDVYARGWQSATMKAIWDNMRGVDLLRSLPEVDARRIGAIGHSLGGHNALFTAAFDSRIRCIITNCGFTSFSAYYGGDLAGWSGPRYMPRIKLEFPTPREMPFDFHDVLGAIAPRAVYVSAPLHDANFDVQGVRDVVESARRVYQHYGAERRFAAVYPDCAHDWPERERKAAYAWLDRQMNHRLSE